MPTSVAADLSFELDRPGQPPVRGHLTGSANRLTLDVDEPGAFAGSGDAGVVRAAGAALAARGLTVRVVSGDLHLITLGAVRVPWWQRRVTRSRHIRLGSVRGAWTAARSRAGGAESVLPDAAMLPPTTLWPIVPTFVRPVRRSPTTTHDPARGGSPRLVLEKERLWAGERQPVYWLEGDRTTIGSGPDCDVRLPGLLDLHAVVRHDDDDEFVVLSRGGLTRVHGAAVTGRQVLRTGARLEVGEHVLAFYREEHADHGRPHGGRIGGELGRQLPQDPRPSHRGPEDPPDL
ncbi:FHA domain-containing protein [Nocardioides dongxiaopingii]|uniref:FHA domain-containing protein n=1 Tax=Nocardioides dongxiaopingii TaxID=2576036 RepID=UPI0010C76C06|nr:FHA domain-containing protein [Nocardioides dongxiaopingii]